MHCRLCCFKSPNWNHLCFCRHFWVAFSFLSIKKRSLFSNVLIFLNMQARHGENALWLVIFKFKSVSSYGRTELTWSLQTMSYDWSELIKFIPFSGHVHPSHVGWSELFQICALLWQGWRHMVSTASLRTLENHKERYKNCKFFSFITKSSATAKLRLPSSS